MRTFFCAGLMLLPTVAAAQVDPIPYVDIQIDTDRYGELLNENSSRRSSQRAGRGRAQQSPAFDQSYFSRPAARDGNDISLAYQGTPALRRDAKERYLDRIARTNLKVAQATSNALAGHDIGRIYTSIVSPFGYRSSDTADALAAYTLLGWLIATGAPDPSRQQAAGVRAQIAPRLAANPRLSGPTTRAELGEELKLLFVTMHAGWQSARREGNLRQYSDGVAALFQRQGTDLRALRLTERGFVGR